MGSRMSVAQVKITQYGVVDEALQNDVLVAGSAGIVDAPETISTTRSRNGIGTDNFGVFLDGFCKEFVIFPFAGWMVLVRRCHT